MPLNIDFGKILEQLKKDIVDLAKITMKGYVDEAKKDGLAFLKSTEDKLRRWTDLLINGDLTKEEFEWLLNSQKDLAVMAALKEAGLAAIRVDQFKSSLLNLIADTVFHLIQV